MREPWSLCQPHQSEKSLSDDDDGDDDDDDNGDDEDMPAPVMAATSSAGK